MTEFFLFLVNWPFKKSLLPNSCARPKLPQMWDQQTDTLVINKHTDSVCLNQHPPLTRNN